MNDLPNRPYRDILAGAALLALAAAYGLLFFDFRQVPAEDAAMLMRYAQHLGQGHGFVWNVGGPPVDGATDFLFMVAVAGLHRLGLGVGVAVVALCALAHVLTVVLVYRGARRYFSAARPMAFVSAAFIALGPGLLYTEAGFGTAFFAFFVTLTWTAALRVAEEPPSGSPFAFALCALLVGLVRPEGVLIAGFMLVALVHWMGLRRSLPAVAWFAGLFAVFGGAYFVWHLKHFGHPLPNPFYAKQGGQFYPWALKLAASDVWTLTFPFGVALACGAAAWVVRAFVAPRDALVARFVRGAGIVLILVALVGLLRASRPDAHDVLYLERYSPRYARLLVRLFLVGLLAAAAAPPIEAALARVARRIRVSNASRQYLKQAAQVAVFVSIPVAGFIVMWSIIEDHTNYLMRFRYPIVPVVAMSWPFILWGVRRRIVSALAATVVLVAVIMLNLSLLPQRHHHDGRYDVAIMLSEHAGRGYGMATTEAGLLPFYSGWRALDLFGLNDPRIAHARRVDDATLDEFGPALIVVAAPWPVETEPPDPEDHMRRHIVQTVHAYARDRSYRLAAAWGETPGKVHYYYVRPGLPETDAIADGIRSMEYDWYLSGRVARDFSRPDGL